MTLKGTIKGKSLSTFCGDQVLVLAIFFQTEKTDDQSGSTEKAPHNRDIKITGFPTETPKNSH